MITNLMMILHYPVKRKTLARDVYRISEKTFKCWLEDIDIIHNGTLSPADLKKIVKTYDLPEGFEIKWS